MLKSRKQILQTPLEHPIDFHIAAKFLIYIFNSLWLKRKKKKDLKKKGYR